MSSAIPRIKALKNSMLQIPMVTASRITAVRLGFRHMLRQPNWKAIQIMFPRSGSLMGSPHLPAMAGTGRRRRIRRVGNRAVRKLMTNTKPPPIATEKMDRSGNTLSGIP